MIRDEGGSGLVLSVITEASGDEAVAATGVMALPFI